MLKSYAKTNDEIANENTSLSSYQKLRHGLIYSSQYSFCTTFIKAFQISFQVLNGRNRGQLFLPIAYDAYLFNCRVYCVSLNLVHSVFKSYPFGVPLSRVKFPKVTAASKLLLPIGIWCSGSAVTIFSSHNRKSNCVLLVSVQRTKQFNNNATEIKAILSRIKENIEDTNAEITLITKASIVEHLHQNHLILVKATCTCLSFLVKR